MFTAINPALLVAIVQDHSQYKKNDHDCFATTDRMPTGSGPEPLVPESSNAELKP